MSVRDSRNPEYIASHRVLLSAEQERQLFTYYSTTRASHALEDIVRAYSPIVAKLAKKFAGYGINHEDLISEGTMALVASAQRYEISTGNRFATYCTAWVRGLMLAYITKNYFSVTVCSNQQMKRLFFNLRRMANQQLRLNERKELGQEFMIAVAKQLKVDVEDVVNMYNMFRKPNESLSDPVGSEDDGDYTRESQIESSDPDPETIVVNDRMIRFHKRLINDAMEMALSDRERMVFQAQVLCDEDDVETLQALANKLSISKERVRQIRNDAMDKVKAMLLDQHGAEFGRDLFQSTAD